MKPPFRYSSVCSGIEAASVAWEHLGWKPVFFSEIDAAPIKVLKHRFPHVPVHGDFTTIKGDDYGADDLLVGGTPCQSFSIAGKRLGLDDPRGNLALEYIRLALRRRTRRFLFENVPGLLSSADGEDFATFLSAATGTVIRTPPGGWKNAGIAKGRADRFGIAWGIRDAQYFRVPQRRRRVFVIGYLGDWRPAAAVLFERESLRGDITPRRETREGVAGCLGARAESGGGFSTDFECDGGLQPVEQQGGVASQKLCAEEETLPTARTATPTFSAVEVADTLGVGANQTTGFKTEVIAQKWPADVAPTLNAHFGEKQGLENQHINEGGGLFVPSNRNGDRSGRRGDCDRSGPDTELQPRSADPGGEGEVS